MPQYKAPLRDMNFVLYELFNLPELLKFPAYQHIDVDLINQALQEGARFCEKELLPFNQSGDLEGCRLENGEVTTPKGFKEIYKKFSEGGWTSFACHTEYGGQGLPELAQIVIEEITCSTNFSFGLYPGLTRGAYLALHAHGSDALKKLYLPKLASGVWAGTMNLTEAHCGTDLGLLKTKAEPQSDGSYKITGTKIFISSGEHDLTENIIHLVLARTPDAPAGTKGISLFLVPKFFVNPDGTLGDRNPVYATSLEHKMGIKASATCTMTYEGATGWLVGELNKGLHHMFTMMNRERLGVGLQGLGISEIAYQSALAYARERLQGRSLSKRMFPDKVADPIIVHPDVRRMLLTMKAYNEGNRMLAGWVASYMDIFHNSLDPEERQACHDFVQLMTPVVKAFFTDRALEITNLAVQVHGGYGYIKEYGVEQYVRDARITQIYEGTNGIQALDLVGRKMGMHMGRPLRTFFHPIQEFIEKHSLEEENQEFIGPLAKAVGYLQQACLTIAQKGLANPEEGAAAAADLLSLFGHTALAYLWAQAALIAKKKVTTQDLPFYNGKIETARFYMQRLLPRTAGEFRTLMSGAKNLMTIRDEEFGPFEGGDIRSILPKAS